MATLALGVAGQALGSALLPGGVSVLGATISGAAIGGAVGTLAGAAIDAALFAPSGQHRVVEGPRLGDVKVSGSTEGAAIARVYGRIRAPGQLIWATRFEEDIVKTKQTTTVSSGGKGFGGGSSQQTTTTTTIEYRYFANVAYGLCEGEIVRVGRIWADGKELDQAQFTIRIYTGSETQEADSLIEAKEGTGNAPAYRGTAYVVFERMPLARFGNRLPQLTFEVFRAVDQFEKTVKAVNMIPSAGEFVYSPARVTRTEDGATIPENEHMRHGGTDWSVSLDQLESQLPETKAVSLLVSWFGDDLRIGECTLRPKVEVANKVTSPVNWSVAGLNRTSAQAVSTHEGTPAYGGTPSDGSVMAAIEDLKARGHAVVFYPFILMDVPQGNSLPNPYSDNAGETGQPSYPWRGRITVSPAPGFDGSPDKTGDAGGQVAAFVGTAQPGDFSTSGETVVYSGPDEWSLRRFILHYAHLCKAAGGVDAFLISSEMRGSTHIRGGTSTYPFVAALIDLAEDVKQVLGAGTKVSYAADWSEYFGHQPQDGSDDVFFHLDPLWASDHIDFIGVDVYWPLSDWRDGEAHLDRQAGAPSIYDLGYLKGNIAGGEGYDWFYPSAGVTGNEPSAERIAQQRTDIADGAHGKPWVFRFKDLQSWWQNQHFNRPGGVEDSTPTGWVPESKPFWFTELGCPAVDKGSNQPNVFIDPKSSESFSPYFSRTTRDDLIQRRYIQAFYEFFDPAHEEYVEGSNPESSVFEGRMVDVSRIFVYTWDARPYPAFPFRLDVWADGGNWELGHWLTGRVAGGPLAAVVAQICEDFGFARYVVAGLDGHLDGYAIDRVMSARSALQPLSLAFFFDGVESSGLIQFTHRGRLGSVATLTPDDLVDSRSGSGTGANEDADLVTLTRGQETELPVSAKLTFIDSQADYRQAAVEARRLAVRSERVSTADIPIALGQSQAQAIAESWLQDAWAARERARFALPPSRLALEPGDIVTLAIGDPAWDLRLTQTSEGAFKTVEALSIEPEVYQALRTPQRVRPLPPPLVFGLAQAEFLDLPLLSGEEPAHAGYVGAHAKPWPGGIAFHRSPSDTGFALNTVVESPMTFGEAVLEFWSGPLHRFDRANSLRVRLDNGELESVSELALLNGANVAAVRNADGEWEVIQFQTAELVAPDTYDLSNLLRGQAGTETAMRNPVSAGARFVLLDASIIPVAMTLDEVGLVFNWKFGPAGRAIDDPAYSDAAHAFQGLGLRPLSPAHVRGRRDPATGDWTFTWIRRTRLGGDSWHSLEVPLGEEREAYEVDILDAGTPLRTIASDSPSVTYTEAQQTEDFGSPQSSCTIRVHQISAFFGRGTPREVTIHV